MSWSNDPHTPDPHKPPSGPPTPPPPAAGSGATPPPAPGFDSPTNPPPVSSQPPAATNEPPAAPQPSQSATNAETDQANPGRPNTRHADAHQPPTPDASDTTESGTHAGEPDGEQPGEDNDEFSAADALTAAFTVYKDNIKTFAALAAINLIGAVVLFTIMQSTGTDSSDVLESVGGNGSLVPPWVNLLFGYSPLSPVIMPLIGLLHFAVGSAVIKAAHTAFDGGTPTIQESFTGVPWVPALAVFLAAQLTIIIGGLLTCFFGFFFLPVLFLFVLPAAVDGKSIGDSLGTVVSMAVKNYAQCLALLYVCLLLIAIGLAACVLPGALASVPVTLIAATYAYRTMADTPVTA